MRERSGSHVCPARRSRGGAARHCFVNQRRRRKSGESRQRRPQAANPTPDAGGAGAEKSGAQPRGRPPGGSREGKRSAAPAGRRRGGPEQAEPPREEARARSGAEGERSEHGAAQGRAKPTGRAQAGPSRTAPQRGPRRGARGAGAARAAGGGRGRQAERAAEGRRRRAKGPPGAGPQDAKPAAKRRGQPGLQAGRGAGAEQGPDKPPHTENAPQLRSSGWATGRGGPGAFARGPGPRAASCGHDGVRGGVEGLRHSTPPMCSLIIDHEKNKSAKNVRYWRTLGRQKYPGRLTEVRRPGILAEMPEFAVLASRQVRGSAPIPQPIEFYHIGRGESSVATSRQGRFFCAEKRERRW